MIKNLSKIINEVNIDYIKLFQSILKYGKIFFVKYFCS